MPEILHSGIFQQGAMPRIGSLFVDLNTTDRVHHRAQILQIAATRLSGNPPEYNDYAIPCRRIHPGAIRYHGITTNYGNLYHNGELVNNPWDCEQALLVDFAAWINRRYDEVFIIYHSPWKQSAMERNLERYNIHIHPEVHYVDIMQKMSNHQHDLELNSVSLDGIFRVLEGNLRRRYGDALQNALGLRRCALNAARNLQIDVKTFLDIDY